MPALRPYLAAHEGAHSFGVGVSGLSIADAGLAAPADAVREGDLGAEGRREAFPEGQAEGEISTDDMRRRSGTPRWLTRTSSMDLSNSVGESMLLKWIVRKARRRWLS